MNDNMTDMSLKNDALGGDWPKFHEHSLLEAAVTEAIRELEISREMALMSALGAIATASQGYIDVEMPTGHRRPTSLMLLTIAESGERKTTTQNYFFDAINKTNSTAYNENQIAKNEYKLKYQIWNIQKRSLEKQYSKDLKQESHASKQALIQHLNSEPTPPRSYKFLYDDTTPQALVQMLYENVPNGCLLTSEANSIFGGKVLEDLDKLNTLWDGGTVIVDRISREGFLLENARLTLAVMAQPSVISRFMGKRGDEARGTGFLSRFLVAKARTMAGQRTNKLLSELPRKQEFNERINSLLNIKNSSNQQVLRFSEPAKDVWFDYSRQLESDMQENKLYFYLKDHASKLLENVSRLAAVVHAFERETDDNTQIDLSTLEFCWRVAKCCSGHFIEHLADEPQLVTDTNLLVNHLLKIAYENQKPNAENDETALNRDARRGAKAEFTLTDIKQRGPGCLRSRAASERLEASIQLLTKLGHIKKSGGRYEFSESIWTRITPELKNGEFINLKALPLHHEQFNPPHQGNYPPDNYYIRSE